MVSFARDVPQTSYPLTEPAQQFMICLESGKEVWADLTHSLLWRRTGYTCYNPHVEGRTYWVKPTDPNKADYLLAEDILQGHGFDRTGLGPFRFHAPAGVYRFQVCFGSIRQNVILMTGWHDFWKDVTTSSNWTKTGYDMYDLEGIDWGWVTASNLEAADFYAAKQILTAYGFTIVLMEFGWRFVAPGQIPYHTNPPCYDPTPEQVSYHRGPPCYEPAPAYNENESLIAIALVQ